MKECNGVDNIIILLIIGLLIFFYVNQKMIIKETFDNEITLKDAEYYNSIDKLIKVSNDDSKSADYSKLFADTYKKKVSTLNSINEELVKDYVKYNDARAKDLNVELTDLEKLTKSKQISLSKRKNNSIQSLQNGLKLNLMTETDDTGGTSDKTLIKLNDGCLSVGTSIPSVKMCNLEDPTQHFTIKKINNNLDYETNIERGLDKIRSNDKIDYPFEIVKSKNTDNCLQNNYGELSVEPCVIRKGQRWVSLEKPVKCIV